MKCPATPQERLFQYAGFAFLLIALGVLVYVLHICVDYLTNSDDAAEFILAHFLAQKNQIVSKEWFYSTEIRALNAQIIFAQLFKFMDNWHWVRVIGTGILCFIFIATYWFFCYAFQCRKYFVWTSIFLILPFSDQWFGFVLKNPYYITYIALVFIALALCEFCAKAPDKKRFFAFLFLSALVAFVAGIGGNRQLVMSYAPLFLAGSLIFLLDWLMLSPTNAETARANRYFSFCTWVSFVFSLLGYAYNRRLLERYSFMRWDWDERKIQFLDFERFKSILNSFWESFGAIPLNFSARSILSNSLSFIFIAIFLLGLFFLIKHRQKNQGAHGRLGFFGVMAAAVLLLIYFFTDMSYIPRYGFGVTVLFIPLLAYGASVLQKDKFLQPAVVLLVVLVFVNSLLFYVETSRTKTEFPTIAQSLADKGYTAGYASFWNANILTELSNGRIEMYAWSTPDLKKLPSIGSMTPWLQKIEHIRTIPQAKVFVFLSTEQDQSNNWPQLSTMGKVEYRSEKFVAYGFDSYEVLAKATQTES